MLNKIRNWIDSENKQLNLSVIYATLATASSNGIPSSRIVAVREISDDSVLFFTQDGTCKVKDMRDNPYASMTVWLPTHQREIVFEGQVIELSKSDNAEYWQSYPRESQLRFLAYAPTSGQRIESPDSLNEKLKLVRDKYAGKDIPLSEHYCGFRLVPTRVYFYEYLTDRLSEVREYIKEGGEWREHWLSP